MRSYPADADPIRALVEAARHDRAWLGGALLLAALVHLLLAFGMVRLPALTRPRRASLSSQVIYIDSPADAPRQPHPLPAEPERAAPRAKPAPRAAKRSSGLAQAGAVLTAKPAPAERLDFTGEGFVIGSSSSYAGGLTSSRGTSPRAVLSSPGPSPAASEPEDAGPDRSRRPALEGSAQWHCPFPPEADAEEIDSAVVPIRVNLDATGAVRDVVVLFDPGHGFAREAERCARAKRFSPALDRRGNPIEAVMAIRVHFER